MAIDSSETAVTEPEPLNYSERDLFRAAYDRPDETVTVVNGLSQAQAMTVDVVRLFGWSLAALSRLPGVMRWLTGVHTFRDLAVALINGDDHPVLRHWQERRNLMPSRPGPTVSETTMRAHLVDLVSVLANRPRSARSAKRLGQKRARDILVARLRPVLPQLTGKMLEHWRADIERDLAQVEPELGRAIAARRSAWKRQLEKMETDELLLDEALVQVVLTRPATPTGI